MNTSILIVCVLVAVTARHLPVAQAERCSALNVDAGVNSVFCTLHDEPVDCIGSMPISTTAMMTCSYGYVIAGRRARTAATTCLNDGSWRNELRCVQDNDRCPAMEVEVGKGAVTCTMNWELVDCSQSMSVGTTAVMSCSYGHVISGKRTSAAATTCLKDGSWRNQLRCVQGVARCPGLSVDAAISSVFCAADGGVVNCSQPMAVSSTAVMTCTPGYVIAGSDVTQQATICLQDGTWRNVSACVPGPAAATLTQPTCPVCPTPICPTPNCPVPSCPAPTCPKPSCPTPNCPTPTCPKPTCPTPICPSCPSIPTLPPPPTCPTCPTPPPTTTPTTTTTTRPTTTPLMLPGYTRIPGVGCYKFHTAALKWTDAKAECEREGSHLVIINSLLEADAISNLIKQNEARVTGTTISGYTWVGVQESMTSQNDFYTVLGEPLNSTGFTQWYVNQPNDVSLGDVVAFDSRDGTLEDRPLASDYLFAFICEQLHC